MEGSLKTRIRMYTAVPQHLKTATQPENPEFSPQLPTGDISFHSRKAFSGESVEDPLNFTDFADVYGGPPLSIISGQFGTGIPLSSSNFFYDEIFRSHEKVPPSKERVGRILKEFIIPTNRVHSQHIPQNHGFYSDIFCSEEDRMRRSRSRSKGSSSSMLSSEEQSPLRAAVSADDDVSLFASKLRPLNMKSRCPSRIFQQDYPIPKNKPVYDGNKPTFNIENERLNSFRNCHLGSSRRNASPEIIGVDPMSNSSFKVSADDLELESSASSSSSVSSVSQSVRDPKTIDVDDILMQDVIEQEDDDILSSYVIEINSDNREGSCESNGVDEAIAWAKEKFQTYCSESKTSQKYEGQTEESLSRTQLSAGHSDISGSRDEQQDVWVAKEEIQPFETQVMDEKIILWSKGKESDIRLLLSSLHHILWPTSGWYMIPLANMIASSKVKKAYQKAQLCLHPDKLQQRGATIPQKYIADKAFSILQDAWESFVSYDVSRH